MNKVKEILRSAFGQRLLILVLICIVMAFWQPRFFYPSNIVSILLTIAVYGIMACGMLFVVLIGGLDLSMGSVAALCAAIASYTTQAGGYTGGAIALGLILAVITALVIGYFHGVLVTSIGMHSFVATLATKYLIYGIVPFITHGAYVYLKGDTFMTKIAMGRPLGIPNSIVIFLVVAVISWFVLSQTTFGRRIYAIGGNPVAAGFVGIKVFRDTRIAFMIASFCAGLGGIVLSSMTTQAGQTTAYGYEGSVLMAMIVGGINLAGGEGGISGAVFGALIVGIITNVINLTGINTDYLKFIQGVVILAVIIIQTLAARRAAHKVKSDKPKKAKAAEATTE